MTSKDPFYDLVIGYPKLAARIGIQPELAIYRRFGALNAQNLLYFQAQLTDLERQLRDQQLQDQRSPKGSKSSYSRHWFSLAESEYDGDTDQLELVLKIRETLKAYNEALMQQSWILEYPKPRKEELHCLQDYLQTPEMGPLALLGGDATTWGSVCDRKSHAADLVALRPRSKKDIFSNLAVDKTLASLLRCGCARFMKPSRVHGVIGYEDRTIFRITYFFTGIVASVVPIASIAVLYHVHSMSARLGIIALFNMLLSICLMTFSSAKRAEVFATTAAFAAVQVVFVGQTSGSVC